MISETAYNLIAIFAALFTVLSSAVIMTGGILLLIYNLFDQILP